MPPYEDPLLRFWRRVDKRDDSKCWLWTGRKIWSGYGMFDWSRKDPQLAHRIAWELANGPIEDGKDVCHSCDVRLCCNPSHMFVGSRSENIKDAFAKGRIRRDGVFNPNHHDYVKPVQEYATFSRT
jgi:hypothetical protein